MRFIDTCSCTESYNPHRYTFSNKCVITGQPYSVTVEGAELYQFRQTGRIDSFQSNSLADREFLISGISPEGWKQESHIVITSYSPQFENPGHIPSHVVVHMSDNTLYKYKREE